MRRSRSTSASCTSTGAIPFAPARAELIATRVESYVLDAGKPNLPAPSISGGAPSGTVEVVITNGSPEKLEFLFSGPRAARSVVIPACSNCSTVFQGLPAEPNCSSAPERTVRVPPGRYSTVARAASDSDVTPFVGKWNLRSGYRYSDCYYIRTRFGR